MSPLAERPPRLCPRLAPPIVLGTAELAHLAYGDADHDGLIHRIHRFHDAIGNDGIGNGGPAARLHDLAQGHLLGFRRFDGLELQDRALAHSRMFRVAGGGRPSLRLLAIMAPGTLMANTPLDFLTNHLDIRLDLLFVLPGEALPAAIPEHDIAFFAVGEAEGEMLDRLRALFDAWPRPALNDPGLLPLLQRDTLSRRLAGAAGICSPAAFAITRQALAADPDVTYPSLLRPRDSHAGAGLSLVRTPAELAEYLRFAFAPEYFVTRFEDYAGPDGLHRKLRVAFVDGAPFLCHMAVSQHWMVHYLNAGMAGCAARRAEEAQAMAAFDTGFARRHAEAFAGLHAHLGFDLYSIDCAETRDGRLLVFEADSAAIIHLMDPPELFPYKPPQMRRVFAAFDALLRRRAAVVQPADIAGRRSRQGVAVS